MFLMLSKRSHTPLSVPVQDQAKVSSGAGSRDQQRGPGHREGSGALVMLFSDSSNRFPRYVYFMKIHGAPYLTSERFSVYVKFL